MRWAVTVIICFMMAVAGGLYFLVKRELTPTIWTTPILEKPSPDGIWTALADETVYEPKFGGSIVIAALHLISAHDPTKIVDILSVDRGDPRIVWASSKVLQVTVPNLSYLVVHRREYGGVRIDLRFDPDDPVQRAAWLKWLHEPHSDKTTRLVETSSPGRDWAAALDQTIYGFSFPPLVNCTVRLIPAGKPLEAVDILSVETNGPNKDPPRMAWTAADVLQVTISIWSYLKIIRQAYRGIRVDVRFNPDDPAARAAWLKKQQQAASPHADR